MIEVQLDALMTLGRYDLAAEAAARFEGNLPNRERLQSIATAIGGKMIDAADLAGFAQAPAEDGASGNPDLVALAVAHADCLSSGDRLLRG